MHEDAIYTERRHIWKEDIYRVGIHMEWGYIWSRDTHGVEKNREWLQIEWGHIGKGHTWSTDKYVEGTNKDTWSGDRYGKRTHTEMGYTRRGDIHREKTDEEGIYGVRIYIKRGYL